MGLWLLPPAFEKGQENKFPRQITAVVATMGINRSPEHVATKHAAGCFHFFRVIFGSLVKLFVASKSIVSNHFYIFFRMEMYV